ncbi:MAG: YkgJ family cysteine cluster protein [Deltaproteobacteria bacterium]|nr:YkgJ family cysteine cluster protein [Deltaproteobacteria bacterium]
MTQPVSLPYRPRLADHAVLRRHLVDGREQLVVHDMVREEMLEIDGRQLQILLGCDGTRDLGGIVLAAVRSGAYHRSSELEALLMELHERGLLADGIVADNQPTPAFPERPVEVLADFSLHCDGNGGCCSSYPAIAFLGDEMDRSRAAVPELWTAHGLGSVEEPGQPSVASFLPLTSSVAGSDWVVTLVDGRCPFLDEEQGCHIHRAAGAEAKPRGCQLFPASFADDGTAVRVSVVVECPCVLASLGRQDGEPLVLAEVKREGELPRCRIERLPEEIAVTPEATAPRGELRSWADALCARLEGMSDGVAGCWALGAAVDEAGLSIGAAELALEQASPPAPTALAMRLMALAGATSGKRESTAAWRSERDRARRLSVWLDDAAQALLDPAAVAARLAEGARWLAHERFYLRATLFGHHLWSREQSIAQALRDRATRLLLARQLAESVPPECQDDAAAPYPLTAVEVMMRGHGLVGYAKGLA